MSDAGQYNKQTMPTTAQLLSDPALGLAREVRQPQLRMAASVEEVINNGGVYICEGPVGLGKTMAYLVPALLAANKRVLVVTAKKQLQDQIIEKDFPAIKAAAGGDLQDAKAVAIKGKGNYTCQMYAGERLYEGPQDRIPYQDFVLRSKYGDRSDYRRSLPTWWDGATAEACIGKYCEMSEQCGYLRLKKDAASARLLVTNHHLLGAEMRFALRSDPESNAGTLIPGVVDVVIIDEAHALEDGIRGAFTYYVNENSARHVEAMLRRTVAFGPLEGVLRKLTADWQEMFRRIADKHRRDPEERKTPALDEGMAIAALSSLDAVVINITETIKALTSKGEDGPVHALSPVEKGKQINQLTSALRYSEDLVAGIEGAQGIVRVDPVITDPAQREEAIQRVNNNRVIYSQHNDAGRFEIACAPVNVSKIARRYFEKIPALIVCSATLAVDGKFDHVVRTIGVNPTKTEVLPTSFNYDSQGFVYVPPDLPNAMRNTPQYDTTMRRRIDIMTRLIELSDGGAFVLTTANDELDVFAEALKQKFPERVFAQSHRKRAWDGDPATVLRKYMSTPDAVLIGSKSFWEGVDVPGGDLRLVIITKLPFGSPNDPILNARQRQIKDKWRRFEEVSLVDMLIDLRQGVGRLIRTKDDRGCVAILDSRVIDNKINYSATVRRALPWSSRTITQDIRIPERYLPAFTSHFRKVAT